METIFAVGTAKRNVIALRSCPMPRNEALVNISSQRLAARTPDEGERQATTARQNGPPVGVVRLFNSLSDDPAIQVTTNPNSYRMLPSTRAFSPPSKSSVRVTSTDVVNIKPAIEPAFCNALRTTLSGSMMPCLYISTYSPVLAL